MLILLQALVWDDALTGPVGLIAEYTLLKVARLIQLLYFGIVINHCLQSSYARAQFVAGRGGTSLSLLLTIPH